MLSALQILAHTSAQPADAEAAVDGLKHLNPERVATGLQTQGGWYLSAIAILVCLYLGRKLLVSQEKAHMRAQEQTALFTKHLDKRDREVKEMLQASTATLAEVGASLTAIAVELRELKNETRTGFDAARDRGQA